MKTIQKTIVVALGGNALQRSGETSVKDQQAVARETARQLVSLALDGHKLVIVHGNGPQVGNIFLHEQALNTPETPASPLDTCVAMSQGEIGYWLQQALQNELLAAKTERNVASVVTQVIVNENDGAFQNPSKPVGPFYTDEASARAVVGKDAAIKEDAGRGWRRVVPSPLPLDIVEKKFIQNALVAGDIVIAAGGGGVPVMLRGGELAGVEGVIDKDRTAAKMAELINADTLLILTTVDAVTINYRQPNETPLHEVTVQEMHQHMAGGQFAPGSMLPKVEAALEFVQLRQGNRAIITSPQKATEALNGTAGTQLVLKP
jgi:carbamate kinase